MSTTTQINMEGNIERECSALGGLFQQIITDMKNGTPLWEDLVTKATKLHTCLRATIQAIAAYLDAFQKIADAATGARGATKEIGTALTRICLRHKAVEARMKNFTSAIMDCLVVPLQEKLEDWKKTVINLDKEHAKEYKRARSELKKRSTDTLRLQKKARKGKSGELQRRVECSLLDVNERRQILEDTEKASVRAALVEERSRFCLFVAFMKPVVDEEVAMLSELSHLQEVVDQLCKHTSDPQALPPASEQVIADLKGSDGGWSFATPPSSPSSLGSRKSSLCSISSLNSSSSGSSKSHHSPSHHYWQRSLSQQPPTAGILRISSVSSQDSGFTSQDVLFPRPPSALSAQVSNMSEHSSGSSSSTTPPAQGVGAGVVGGSVGALPILPAAANAATWPNLQETLQFERAASAIMSDRPHTISSAYAHGHQRPALTVYTYQSSAVSLSQPSSPVSSPALTGLAPSGTPPGSPKPGVARPPVPSRASSLERPSVPAKTGFGLARIKHDAVKAMPKQLSKVVGVDQVQPMYVNMSELAHLAASKAAEMSFALPPPPEFAPRTPDKAEPAEKDGSTSESSLESSSGYGSQTIPVVDDATSHPEDVCTSLEAASAGKYATLPRHSEFALAGALRRRPVSTAGYPTGCAIRSTLLRRSSIQCHKPPPPIRRTSSISTSFRAHLTPVGGSMEHLPPPPAFLLEGGGAGGGGVASVADTVRTLTELNHQPASPSAARRGSRSLSAERRGPPEGLIAALSAKLSPALSPRTQRRHSEDKHNAISRGPGPGAGFLHALNSKLAAQHVSVNQHQQQQPKANRIRQFISARIAPDPTLCHESLMDQIKRGTRLKRTRSVNDRSAPKIR